MAIFLTGATGFLGREIVKQLLGSNVEKIYLLVRTQSLKKAQELFSDLLGKIEFICGDLNNDALLNDIEQLSILAKEIDTVVHLAADYHINSNYADAYRANVVGMQNIIHFCNQLPQLQHFVYASTIAIAGNHRGVFKEKDFNLGQHFADAYGQTKFRAEGLVGSWKTPVKKFVLRYGVIVGHSRNGYINKIDGPYYFLKLLDKIQNLKPLFNRLGLFPLPFHPKSKLYLVPVDIAAEATLMVIKHPPAISPGQYRTYHICGPGMRLIEFVEISLGHYGITAKPFPIHHRLIPKSLYDMMDFPAELIFYMQNELEFDQSNLKSDFPSLHLPDFTEFKNAFFDYIPTLFCKDLS